jgi:DnaJ-related protein SCJ1
MTRGRHLLLLLALACVVALAAAGKDYYEVLGVSRDASSAEIKRAFRKLSLKVRGRRCPIQIKLCSHTYLF